MDKQEFLKQEVEGAAKRSTPKCSICGKELYHKYEDNICLYCLLDEDDFREDR